MIAGWRAKPGAAVTALFYAAYFAAIGVYLPFWPVWLSDWGLSAAEVGAYISAGFAARVVAGAALPWIADATGRPRRVAAVLAGLGAALFLAHLLIGERALLLAAKLATAAILAGLLPIGDALSLRAAARGGFSYAAARSAGSAAFLGANLLGGAAVAAFGADAALWWIAAALAPLVWLALVHPGGAGAPLNPPRLAEAGRLIRAPPFLWLTLSVATLQGSHAVLYAYGSLHWRAQGIGDSLIGALWALSVGVEIALMLFAGARLTARFGPAGAMMLAGGAGLIRWGAMCLDPPLALLWPLQALHALTFAASYLGAMAFIQAAAPERLTATAQGISQAVAGGLAMAGASALAARVYPVAGGGAYAIALALSLTGLIAAARLGVVWRGERLAV